MMWSEELRMITMKACREHNAALTMANDKLRAEREAAMADAARGRELAKTVFNEYYSGTKNNNRVAWNIDLLDDWAEL